MEPTSQAQNDSIKNAQPQDLIDGQNEEDFNEKKRAEFESHLEAQSKFTESSIYEQT